MDWKQRAEKLRFDEGKSWRQIAEELHGCFPGLNLQQVLEKVRRYLRDTPRYKEIVRKPDEPPKKYKEGFRRNDDGTAESDKLITICETDEITPELLMKLHHLDVGTWEVVSYINNYWHSPVKGGKRLVMYQSKLRVKPRATASLAEVEKFYHRLDRKYALPVVRFAPSKSEYMAEVNIADLHLGKLCWHGDTGNNYDYKIARAVFNYIIADVGNELRRIGVNKILFVWANDFFNSDTISKTTTAGTPQDTDIRWQKLFNIGCEMLVDGITRLSEIAPVETFYTASNHDNMTSYHATQFLAAWFRKSPNVVVNADAKARKYYIYGNTLLGFTHGDKEKPKQLSMLMPLEVPQLWSQSIYREMHTAHLHSEQEKVNENGIIIRRISSPTATDAWHYESGYVGAIRKAQTFVYHKEMGLKYTINTPISQRFYEG